MVNVCIRLVNIARVPGPPENRVNVNTLRSPFDNTTKFLWAHPQSFASPHAPTNQENRRATQHVMSIKKAIKIMIKIRVN